MNRDQILGTAKIVRGKIRAAVGKSVGDITMEAKGKAGQADGRIQRAVGNIRAGLGTT